MEHKPRKKYSREFKLEAVRLAAVDERPKAQVARELGIRVNLLRNWRLEFEREERKPVARVGTVASSAKRTPAAAEDAHHADQCDPQCQP